MDMRRLFLFLIFSFSLVVLWGAWTRQNEPVAPVVNASKPADPSIPTEPVRAAPATVATATATVETQKAPGGKKIAVTTDTMSVEINTAGGNIQHLDLLQHKDANDQSKPLTLMQQQGEHTYVAQTGLLGKDLPTHNAEFSAAAEE
jgi:YidC/Oxa1 family membrane protein insertase